MIASKDMIGGQTSRLTRTQPVFSPRQRCEAQQGEGKGLREPKELEGPTDTRPIPPWLLKIAGCWGIPKPSTFHAHL